MSKERIKQLRDLLNHYNHQYYVEANPSVSDAVYDSLMKELIALEQEFQDFDSNSPSRRVGGKAVAEFVKVIHRSPMISLANAFSAQDLIDFDETIKKSTGLKQVDYICELKIDGLSISIIYENGRFFKAATRGNGLIGEDVSENVKTIKSIPLSIKAEGTLEVRGEVYMAKQVFADLNKQRASNGEQLFANPRNAAAGSLRQLNPQIVAKRNLDAFLFYLDNQGNQINQDQSLANLKLLGFKVNPEYKKCSGIEQVINFVNKVAEKRKSLKYDIDGVVVKVNNVDLHGKLGQTAKAPKWAIAYKFPPEEAISKLLAVNVGVGRSGKITPVAIITPTFVAGSQISKITLNNYDFIKSKDIMINDTIIIRKAGDVIPEIVGVIKEKRDSTQTAIEIIKKCPACQSPVQKFDNGVDYYCINNDCPSRNVQALIHFASREAMNIDGLGERLIQILYEKNLLTTIYEIYLLKFKKDEMISIEGMGERSVNALLKSIEDSKDRQLDKLLIGLGIPEIGEKNAKVLAKYYKNIDNLIVASREELLALENFGVVMADSILSFFADPKNKETIFKLKMLGINTTQEQKEVKMELFANKTVVITGSFIKYNRKELTTILEDLGANVTGSVSKKTDIVFVGEDAGSKLKEANRLGIKVVMEAELEELLGGIK